MKRQPFWAVLAAVSCASGGAFHEGRTALGQAERGLLGRSPQGRGAGFSKLWRRPGVLQLGLLKWSEERSFAVAGAPPDLLESVRDEIGGLNRASRTGQDVRVAVVVYEYARTWFRGARLSYEVTVRDPSGKLVLAADDTVFPGDIPPRSLAETDSQIVARAICGKLGKELAP